MRKVARAPEGCDGMLRLPPLRPVTAIPGRARPLYRTLVGAILWVADEFDLLLLALAGSLAGQGGAEGLLAPADAAGMERCSGRSIW